MNEKPIANELIEEENVETISQLKKCSVLIIHEMQADICYSVQKNSFMKIRKTNEITAK